MPTNPSQVKRLTTSPHKFAGTKVAHPENGYFHPVKVRTKYS